MRWILEAISSPHKELLNIVLGSGHETHVQFTLLPTAPADEVLMPDLSSQSYNSDDHNLVSF